MTKKQTDTKKEIEKVEEQYGYKKLDKNSSIADLMRNIEATKKYAEDFEENLNSLEQSLN